MAAILITHCHFDHIGAVKALHDATGAPVYCPELEREVLADINSYVSFPGVGPFESYDADQTVAGGETLELAGLSFDVRFTPGHSAGHVTYSVRDEAALFCGDVLFQGSVGRVDLPGGDWPTLLASIEALMDEFPADTHVYPGHMASPRSARARHQPLPPRTRTVAVSLQAPTGTYDVLPQDRERRRALAVNAERILGAAATGGSRRQCSRRPSCSRAGWGASTDIVQKEMYSFDDGGGRSLTLRPEGTAPVCRAYIEHGMHKLPQPVKLWYFSQFFRAERPQKGRYRQFWQIGAEAIGAESPETDAELIVLLAELLESMGVKGTRLRLASLGTPETRVEYRAELTAYLRAHEAELSAEVRARIELNPMRAFDASDPGTQRVMAAAPKLLDRLAPEDAEHFATVRSLLDVTGISYELDPTLVRGLDYYTRTLFEFSSDALGAQSGVGGGGRYDRLIEQLGGQPTPGIGFAAGVERILLAAPRAGHPAPARRPARDSFRPWTPARRTWPRSRLPARRGEPACPRSWS